MLKDHPYRINDIELPFARAWEESYGKIEKVKTTEDGHKDKTTVRDNILNVKVSIQCKSDLAAALEAVSQNDSVTLTRYNIVSQSEETRTMWMEDFQKNLIEESWKLKTTDGVWLVSFKLEEV